MKVSVFMYGVTILMAAALSVGSFLGFPADPVLGGMFWLIVTLLLIVGGVESV